DDEYNASFAVSKLNLVKKPITITPKKTSYTFTASAKNKYVEATLSTIKNKYDGKMYLSQGKKVTLTINGKTYTATAGKNGAIKFNIGSTTKKGTYKVTIKYAGDATYEAGTSKTITIKLS
ncbi:MAG: Ig-like domain repeat protein, partial [Methanobrevibacter sp.]|nr:Ig-like domain repeat protein [Methanobrevibacter sp.]